MSETIAETPVEAPAEPTELSQDEFGAIAAERMAEVFGTTTDTPVPETEATPAPEAEAEVETPAAETPTEDVRRNAAGRAINEQGQFIPEPGETAAAETPQMDPAVAAALQAAAAANARAEALEAQMTQLQAGVNQRLTMPPDQLAELVEDDPRQAAHVARNQGDLATMDEALRAWAAEGPSESYEASAFRADVDRRIQAWEADQHAQQAAQAAQAQTVQRDLTPIAQVLKTRPDMAAMAPQMDAIAPKYPLLQHAISTDDPFAQAEGLAALYDLAKQQHVTATVADAQSQADATAAAQAAQDRADATVVSASQGAGNTTAASFDDEVRSGFLEAARALGHMNRT